MAVTKDFYGDHMARSHVITQWNPEDGAAWAAGNDKIARRNLVWSTVAEHAGFSIWSIWSVMVLCMPESVYGFTAGQVFLGFVALFIVSGIGNGSVSATTAFWIFLVGYVGAAALTWRRYVRRSDFAPQPARAALAPA